MEQTRRRSVSLTTSGKGWYLFLLVLLGAPAVLALAMFALVKCGGPQAGDKPPPYRE